MPDSSSSTADGAQETDASAAASMMDVPKIQVSKVDGVPRHGECDGPEGSARHDAFIKHSADYTEAEEVIVGDVPYDAEQATAMHS